MGRKKYSNIQEALSDLKPQSPHDYTYKDVRVGNNIVTIRKGERSEPGMLLKDPGPTKKIARAIVK